MIRKKPNKEIDQMFLGMGLTGSVALSRPNRGTWIIKLVIFLLGAIIIATGIYWFVFRSNLVLAKQMPKDSFVYINLSLPQNNIWYNQLLFWKANSLPSDQTSRIYQKLNILEWEDVKFFEDITTSISGKLEMGMLPSGEIVLGANLKNKDYWFNIFNLQPEDYNGQLVEISSPVSGWISNFASNKNQWYWFVENDFLYITSSSLIKDKLGGISKNNSLKGDIKDYDNNIALIYINNSLILENNKYLDFFNNQTTLPIVVSVAQKKDKIVFSNLKNSELDSFTNSNTQVVRHNSVSDRDLMIYFDDIGNSFDKYDKNIIPGIESVTSLGLLINDLYNIDTQDVIQKLTGESALLSISSEENIVENEWTLVVQSESNEQNNIKDVLKSIGIQLFAISHPISVENTLRDGTIMTELRAETDGIEWEKQVYAHDGVNTELDSLQGKGEPSGYYVGHVESVGVVLSSSLEHLGQTITKLDRKTQQNNENDLCYTSQSGISVTSSINFFESDEFINNLLDYVTINSLDDNKFLGCLFFE
jgi:hypothetical protein